MRSSGVIPAGKVTVAVAKGKKGRRFRTLGKAKVSSKGVFKLRFRLTKTGYYRLRYALERSDGSVIAYSPVRDWHLVASSATRLERSRHRHPTSSPTPASSRSETSPAS